MFDQPAGIYDAKGVLCVRISASYGVDKYNGKLRHFKKVKKTKKSCRTKRKLSRLKNEKEDDTHPDILAAELAYQQEVASAGFGGEIPKSFGSGAAKRKRFKKKAASDADDIPPTGVIAKYWFQRFRLFSKYNEGIRLDAEGWYSATPEVIAAHIAERCVCDVIIDAFAGCGGNAIQFALRCRHVIAIEIDPYRIECARHNAKVYGVVDRIDFILGDAIEILPLLRADVVFLSPPWGGPDYLKEKIFDVETMIAPKSMTELLKISRKVTSNITLFLPRNTQPIQIASISQGDVCEFEFNFINWVHKSKTVTLYYGDLVDTTSTCEQELMTQT